MSVRINLLPDLRQQKLREKHRRQSATVVAVVIWIVTGGIVLLLALYNGTQKLSINDLTHKINDKKTQLTGTEGLIDAITAQQHLSSLPTLDNQRVYFTKFFAAYSKLAPGDVVLNSLSVDATNTLKVAGSATSYLSVAKLAEAMSAQSTGTTTSTSTSTAGTSSQYFTGVNIDQVSRGNNGQVSFSLTATVAPGATSGNN